MSPHTLPKPFRPLPIRAMNATGRLLERVGLQTVALDEASLTRAASRTAGLDDYGDERFRPGFRRLLRSLEEDAALNPFGRYFAKRQLIELLVTRLQIVDHRKQHPEVAARRAALQGQGSQFSTGMALALGALFCTVAGYFGIQPQMAAARAGQGALSFGQLHAISTVFFAFKLTLVAALAWRATRAPAISPTAAS